MTRKRKVRRGCAVEVHRGRLRLRFTRNGKRSSRTLLGGIDSEDRKRAEKLANAVAALISANRDPFELLDPPKADPSPSGMTVAQYFDLWIADKIPPSVRKAQARDYRRHIRGYVLPKLGQIPIAELSARDIHGLKAELLGRGLSVKYVKNIMSGSFKKMINDAREIDEITTRQPFVGLRWGRTPVPGPDPFTAEERARILGWLETKRFGLHCGLAKSGPRIQCHPPYAAYAHLLFWTGMRPSEASGLRWGEVDLGARVVRVVRSRHLWEESAPKTAQAARTVDLVPETVRLLRALQPLHTTPEMPVFTNIAGAPIEPNSFLRPWYACLRALGIRVRGLYCMKDTFVSNALTAGVNTAWLEAQTGVRYDTLRRHYGTWLRNEGASQIQKLIDFAPARLPAAVNEEDGSMSLRERMRDTTGMIIKRPDGTRIIVDQNRKAQVILPEEHDPEQKGEFASTKPAHGRID